MIAAGKPEQFAIRTRISEFYPSNSLLALGSYTLFINGEAFGLIADDATTLGSAFRETKRRSADAGKHVATFSSEPDGRKLISIINDARNGENVSGKSFYGMDVECFINALRDSRSGWHWYCSEAFDDGSCVWQFDCDGGVRLIAQNGYVFRDVVIPASQFYGVLRDWVTQFEREMKKNGVDVT